MVCGKSSVEYIFKTNVNSYTPRLLSACLTVVLMVLLLLYKENIFKIICSNYNNHKIITKCGT